MNINELRKIIENEPEWSTHIENGYKIVYWNLNQLASPKWFDGEGWYSGTPSGLVHSLSDIKTIIELYDFIELDVMQTLSFHTKSKAEELLGKLK